MLLVAVHILRPKSTILMEMETMESFGCLDLAEVGSGRRWGWQCELTGRSTGLRSVGTTIDGHGALNLDFHDRRSFDASAGLAKAMKHGPYCGRQYADD